MMEVESGIDELMNLSTDEQKTRRGPARGMACTRHILTLQINTFDIDMKIYLRLSRANLKLTTRDGHLHEG